MTAAYAEAVLDPIAAAQRRARLGLDLELHPPNEDTPQRPAAGRRGVRRHQGIKANASKKSDRSISGELQFASG